MKRRLLFLAAVFLCWLLLLALQKPVFMLYHIGLAGGSSVTDWLAVIRYGLRLDIAVAVYLTIIPLLAVVLSFNIKERHWRWLTVGLRIYFATVLFAMAVIFFVDMALYTFWGFRLDATILFYIQFPGGAMASMPVWISIRQALFSMIYIALGLWLFYGWAMRFFRVDSGEEKRATRIVIALPLLVFVFGIVENKGFMRSTIGSVYFSERQFLNHAAINPAFSLVSSVIKQLDFGSQFRFENEEMREEVFSSLFAPAPGGSDTAAMQMLRTPRPSNIVLIILESFSANAIEPLGGTPGITPCLNKIAGEGILFSNVYASSFRTDRALPAILNGYPAQPTTSLMKYPAKCASLPSLAKSLSAEGYSTEMLYGGDITYTNMLSYFNGSGYQKIISGKDFPPTQLLNKWGANDDVTFSYLHRMLTDNPDTTRLRFTTFLTISSHEPFDVPYHRLKELYPNAVAFTDSCIGAFVDSLKASPVWNNTLIVFMADHGFRYPDHLSEYEPARYHIPLLWAGGAVARQAKIETIASQNDLAATLLGALGINADDYLFSRNIFNPDVPPFAFYTFSNGFGFVDPTGATAYDNDSNRRLMFIPEEGGRERLDKGKVLLQTLYKDLGSR
ncbi:MAG: sulfatase-like hydrolase/transferase [Tannerellaceae bacterium]|jgi:phosphoglycerol transferase MdoB-like AlkP superfamily enzyme|nr:sulfatase-like hydrolase/transferase [Tannerellaceae bacterium]